MKIRKDESASDEVDSSVVPYADQLLTEAREELVRADTKAAMLLAGGAVLVGLLLNAVISDKWSPGDLERLARVLWWLGAAVFNSGIAMLGYCIYPRIVRSDDRRHVHYFGHCAAYKSPQDMKPDIIKAASQPLERSLDQLWQVSRIVMTKYRLLRWALRLYALGLFCCTLAGTMSHLFG